MVGAEVGDREVDKLIQVHWHDGGDDLVLVHVEVQAQGELDFAQRMCVYNCRIWERYRRPVVSLALLVDGDPQFRPDRFTRERAGCRLEFTFPVVKLLDYKSAAGIGGRSEPVCRGLAGPAEQTAGGQRRDRRFAFKLALAHELYRRGYDREDVLKLFRFMDYVLTLPGSCPGGSTANWRTSRRS